MHPSTGLPGLDKILHGIRPGDNIVWQVDTIDDFLPFVNPFYKHARTNRRKIVYFRFAKHRELVTEESGVQVYQLYPEKGFEKFITDIHSIIKQNGDKTYYIFDSLSELALDCFSERMTGNFFMLTIPVLNKYETIAYFSVIRNYNSHHAAQPIAQTTQLILDVYSHQGKRYVHPLKVDQRYSPSMYLLHLWDGDDFVPIKESATISSVSTSGPWHGLQSASYRMVGLWDRRFMHAEEILESFKRNECPKEQVEEVFKKQLRQIISRDDRILSLAEKYFTLADIIHIWKRTIGSGFIGGKSVGMLLSRAILKNTSKDWAEILEEHDSFFIGSDIFYTYLVQNGCWEIRQKQKKCDTLFSDADKARKLILKGNFPDYIIRRFSDMLDYFGQSPIIVRSSSLLEDNYGNAFAGKYESIFCVNCGTHEQRLEEFINAIRTVYASAMSEEALDYREKRGVLDRDEQMALLVQRVSGVEYDNLFYPQLAGVGVSYNSYAWDEDIDPEAGLLRLVFGLGTRAVDRCDDDYTRIVALNAPMKRPEGNPDEVRKHAQKRVDFLDLEKNKFNYGYFMDVIKQSPGIPIDMFATVDREAERNAKKKSKIPPKLIAFDKVFKETDFIKNMREMLDTLRKVYECHLDIEYTANFLEDGTYKINLLQCRPLQVKGEVITVDTIPDIDSNNIILEAHGGIVGQSRTITIDRIIYVVPSVYGKLPEQDRYAVARMIGKLTHYKEQGEQKAIMIIGPGRWGTRMPSLGVPVSISEINTVTVVCEVDQMHEGLTPDLSLGTHFFNDLVEMNMLYIAFFANRKDNIINNDFFRKSHNHITDILPDSSSMTDLIKVIDKKEGEDIFLNADFVKQVSILYTKK
ncbi:PEP/pyruvate-binding domain-containing protein [Elusimicrobiota bacterium]